MHLIVHATVRDGAESIDKIRKDVDDCFATLSVVEVVEGCFMTTAATVPPLEDLVVNLVSLEQLHDPQLDIGIFFVNDGSRWIVTDTVKELAKATSIAGRAPEVV